MQMWAERGWMCREASKVGGTQDVGSMGPWICKMFLCKGCLSDVGVDSGCAVDVNKRTKRSCNPISGQKFTQHEY